MKKDCANSLFSYQIKENWRGKKTSPAKSSTSKALRAVMPIKSSTMLPISNSFEKAPESSKASIEKYSRNNTKQKVGERGYN